MVDKRTSKKAYEHTWEGGTDVHEGVMLYSRFSAQVTQNEDNLSLSLFICHGQ